MRQRSRPRTCELGRGTGSLQRTKMSSSQMAAGWPQGEEAEAQVPGEEVTDGLQEW